MTCRLIVNADDFGLNERVNAAVVRAHREGILTSASLMVGGGAWQQAVDLARSNATLGVGLHVTVTYDAAVLPAPEVSRLVDRNGNMSRSPLHAGMLYWRSRPAQAQLAREIEAQFERFASTGLPWSHVDGHQHFHLHPFVWETFVSLCDRYGVHRIRLPHEEFRAHFMTGGAGPSVNTAAYAAIAILRRRRLQDLAVRAAEGKPHFTACDRSYGTLQSGQVGAAYLRRLIGRLCGTTNEVFLHPGTDYATRLRQGRAGVVDVEMDALLDSGVREALDRAGICLSTYMASFGDQPSPVS